MDMMNNRRREQIKLTTKWVLYSVVIIISSVLVTMGSGQLIKPLLLIPVIVSISMSENELVSGIVGAVCGILLDIITGKLLGFNAVVMLILAAVSSFMFLHLLKRNILNAIVATAVVAVFQGVLDLFFNYVMWDVNNYSTVLTKKILPSVFMTILSSPIIYLIIKFISIKLSPKERIEVEQN